MNDDQLRKYIRKHGGEAVRAAAAGDWETAGLVIAKINNAGGLGTFLYGLCDSIIDLNRRSGRTAGHEVTLAPVTSTGEGNIPGYYTWCGLFLAARFRLDREACEALLEEFPADWDEASPYIMTLLRGCAALINPGQPGGERA